MDNRKFIFLFGAIFALACLPFVILYPSGEASAGLSHGFLSSLVPDLDFWLIVLVGFGAVSTGRDAMVLVPVTVVLLYAIAAMAQIDMARYPLVPWFLTGGILAYAAALTLVDSRKFVVAVAVSSSIAFHAGTQAGHAVSHTDDPLYFLLGQLLALSLVTAASVCFAMAFLENGLHFFNRAFLRTENRLLSVLRTWLF